MGEEFIRRIMVLGSVPSLGPVMLFDNLEDLFKWSAGGTGADYVVEKSTTVAYNGSACLHMKTRATGAAAGDVVNSFRDLFQRPGKRYRLEFLMRFEVEAATRYLTWYGTIWDGATKHEISVRHDVVNMLWQYLGSDGSYHNISGSSQRLNNIAWHRVCLSFDEYSKTYVSLISDGLVMSLDGVAYLSSANTDPVRFRSLVEETANSSARPDCYFDDFLVMEI